MFCVYCGSKIEESSTVCPRCGSLLRDQNGNIAIQNNAFVRNMNIQNASNLNFIVKDRSNWRETISVVAGVIGLFFAIVIFSCYEEMILEDIVYFKEYPISLAIGMLLIQTVMAVLSLAFAIASRKVNKNSINMTGLVMSLIIAIITIIQFILILTYQI